MPVRENSGSAAHEDLPTVLLAVRQQLLREGLRQVLQSDRFRIVAECSTATEAAEIAERLHPTVAILYLDGFDDIKEIHRVSPQTRIVLISQTAEQPLTLDHLRNGVKGCFCNDQPVESLVFVVSEVVRGAVCWNTEWPRVAAPISQRHPLTRREQEVLQLIAEGVSTREIGQRLQLSPKTIEGHRAKLMAKLGVHDITGLVRYAIRQGMIQA